MTQALERCTPLLIAAVGAMARDGLDVMPGDALDLVHEFYADAMEGFLARHDPSLGTFTTYVFGGFRRFAYRRIGRRARARRLLVPLDDVLDEAMKCPAREEAETARIEADAQRFADALARLPLRFRQILEARLGGCETERDLAGRLKLSRHAVHDRLAEAFGRLAVALNHDETIRADLRPFAVRVWRDMIPLNQLAKELNLSRREMRKRYREMVRSLRATTMSTLKKALAPRKRVSNG